MKKYLNIFVVATTVLAIIHQLIQPHIDWNLVCWQTVALLWMLNAFLTERSLERCKDLIESITKSSTGSTKL